MIEDDTDAAGRRVIDSSAIPRQRTVEAFASGGEVLVYSATRDEASALNRTAAEIWELCDGERTVAAIATALAQRYGVDDSYLLADVHAAVTALRARGLIDVSDTGDDAS